MGGEVGGAKDGFQILVENPGGGKGAQLGLVGDGDAVELLRVHTCAHLSREGGRERGREGR